MNEDTYENEPLQRAGRGPNARIKASAIRPESIREGGENRTAGTRLQRNRKRSEDKFYVDPQLVPDGITYEWKREKCYGQPDPDHISNLMDNHWSPVPQDRHKNLVTQKDGMILMERPAYLTEDARREDYNLAVDQVRSVGANVSDTPIGTFTRDHASVKRVSRVKSDFNLAIPEE